MAYFKASGNAVNLFTKISWGAKIKSPILKSSPRFSYIPSMYVCNIYHCTSFSEYSYLNRAIFPSANWFRKEMSFNVIPSVEIFFLTIECVLKLLHVITAYETLQFVLYSQKCWGKPL